jgi:hypothetical protein
MDDLGFRDVSFNYLKEKRLDKRNPHRNPHRSRQQILFELQFILITMGNPKGNPIISYRTWAPAR